MNSNDKILVSVIIPVYNRKELLKEAIKSVVNQSFGDFELIIADDSSSEDIRSAVSAVPGINDVTLRWLRLEKHTGMAGMERNHGVDAAKAEYIAFLDSDDLWEKDKLEKQYKLMQDLKKLSEQNPENCRIRITHTREKWLRGDKVVSQKSQKHKREGDIFEDALWKCIIGPSTVMLEKSLFYEAGGFREDLEVAEDYELWLKITAHEKVGYIDEMLTVKRAGEWDQLSEKHGQIEIFRIDALKGLLERNYFEEGRRMLAEEVFSRKCSIYASGCRKRGKEEEALYYEKLAEKYLTDQPC